MQKSAQLSRCSFELRVISGVQYVGFRLPSVDTKDNSCQKQWHGVRLVNNEENVMLVLFFFWFNDKRKTIPL